MNKQTKLLKAQAKFEALLSISWWTLGEEAQEFHGRETEKVVKEIEDLQRAIQAEKEVKATIKKMRDSGMIEKIEI